MRVRSAIAMMKMHRAIEVFAQMHVEPCRTARYLVAVDQDAVNAGLAGVSGFLCSRRGV